MKLSFSALISSLFGSTLLLSSSLSPALVEGNVSIRGNSETAAKLVKVARRLEENGGGEEDELQFLMNYSLKLISCIDNERVINYENNDGGGDNNEYENSAVVFRLCPSNTCDASDKYGCDSGYGDYVIGINTFMELYGRYQEEEQEQQQQNNNNNNGQQQYSSLVAYNQYGVAFDASEYMECREYNPEEAMNEAEENGYYYGNNNGQQQNGGGGNNANNNYYNYGNNGNNNYYNYNNNGGDGEGGGEDVRFFIGPGCSADGKSIGLKLYWNEECTYSASHVPFSQLSYGMWPDGLPFSNGGLVSMNCVDCYGMNENYEYEMNEVCEELYQSRSSSCEQPEFTSSKGYNNNYNYDNGQQQQQQENNNGENNNQAQQNYYNQQGQQDGYYYGGQQVINQCSYIEGLMNRNKNLFSASNEGLITFGIVLVLLCAVGVVYFLYTRFLAKKDNNALLTLDEKGEIS